MDLKHLLCIAFGFTVGTIFTGYTWSVKVQTLYKIIQDLRKGEGK